MTSINCFINAEEAMCEYEQRFEEIYLEKALDFYNQVIAKDVAYGEAYYKRSFVYGLLEEYDSQLKDLDMAIIIFEDKLKQTPDNEEILFNLGMAYRHYYSFMHGTI